MNTQPNEVKIPDLYETDGIKADEKKIYQAYEHPVVKFYWLVAELNKEGDTAFGYANLRDDQMAEWGYISIEELNENGAVPIPDWKICSFVEAKEIMKARLA